MKEDDMRLIGHLIGRLAREGESAVNEVKEQVLALCGRFPLYPDL
jgi:glycine/serine hydroxymethyltransferase